MVARSACRAASVSVGVPTSRRLAAPGSVIQWGTRPRVPSGISTEKCKAPAWWTVRITNARAPTRG
jgi:hypothetical protein